MNVVEMHGLALFALLFIEMSYKQNTAIGYLFKGD